MKKLGILLGVVLLSLIANVSATVDDDVVYTIIDGLVYDILTHDPIVNAVVEVFCQGAYNQTTTDDFGYYNSLFIPEDCSVGEEIQVIARKGTLMGEASGVVGYSNESDNVYASEINVPFGIEYTVVAGFVRDPITEEPVPDAYVEVICHGKVNISKNKITNENGHYRFFFKPRRCRLGDFVEVKASSGGLTGENSGFVMESINFFNIYTARIDVPLVPEFGFYVGLLTMISAIGIFFFVRK